MTEPLTWSRMKSKIAMPIPTPAAAIKSLLNATAITTAMTAKSGRLDFAVIAVVIAVALSRDLIAAAGVGIGMAILLFFREQVRGRKSVGREGEEVTNYEDCDT